MPGWQPIRGWQHSVVSHRERHLESGETKPGMERAYNGGVWGSTAETRQARVSLHYFFRGRGRPPWPHKHPLGLATLGHMTKRVTFRLCCGVHPPTVPVFVWFQVLALTHSSSSGGGQSTNCVLWLSTPQDSPPAVCFACGWVKWMSLYWGRNFDKEPMQILWKHNIPPLKQPLVARLLLIDYIMWIFSNLRLDWENKGCHHGKLFCRCMLTL